jgi:hypothetical protein
MKKFTGVCALALVVGACSGGSNPFTAVTAVVDPAAEPDTGGGTSDSLVPATIANDLESLSYDAATQTLTVTGLTQDGTPLNNEYRHITTSFVDGYETFTAQNDPLGRHATAFVASRDGVQAGMVLTGGQFNHFFGGTYFERDGDYEAPVTPEGRFDVTYHGNYAAGVNSAGPVTDLLPLVGTDDSVGGASQAAYVRGLMFVNVDLNDLSVEGEIYNRTYVGQLTPNTDPTVPGFTGLPDIVLVDGVLADNGTFSGNLERDNDENDVPNEGVGTFAGLIGGPEGVTIAGGTELADFADGFEEGIEYGVFVLDICQEGDGGPICTNAFPPTP